MINTAIEKLKTFIYKDTQLLVHEGDMHVVWSCKTLQNFKCLIYTPTLKMYFELTYDGDKNKWYIDGYQKVKNEEIA